MPIGDRLRALREAKKYSQGDIENRTGLLRCYISRVENRHTVPTVETLEKFARAQEVPIYPFFFTRARSRPKCRIIRRVKLPMTLLGQQAQGHTYAQPILSSFRPHG